MANTSATGPLAFLGVGVLRPFQRDRKNDFANGSGGALFAARLGQILGTKASTPASPGELPWRTDFGSRFHVLRHANNNDVLPDLARVYAIQAVQKWEPGVVVTDTEIDQTSIPRTIVVTVYFNIVDQAGQTTLANQSTKVPITTTEASQ